MKATKSKTATTTATNLSKTKISGLKVSKSGLCYNSTTKKFIAVTNGKTTINGKQYNVSKLILETFLSIPVRKGQIIFKNGNSKDLRIENLEYKTNVAETPPKENDLITCIRLYFQVDKSLTSRGKLIKNYIYEIIKKRSFEKKYKGKDFSLFIDYFKTEFVYLSSNQTKIFEKYNVSQRNGKSIINKYLNLLINECLQDFENGFLKIQEFKPVPKTQTQKLKEFQTVANELGYKVKIPLRKQSTKELLNSYKKKVNAINENSKKPL